jgi:hypothetical protein
LLTAVLALRVNLDDKNSVSERSRDRDNADDIIAIQVLVNDSAAVVAKADSRSLSGVPANGHMG